MKSRPLGRTGLVVTELGFGAAAIGNLYQAVDEDTARAAVDAAWAAGIRYFDTAPHYGLGLSEQRLGAALADKPRHEYVISTKVGRILVPNTRPTGTDLTAGFAVPDALARIRDYSRDGILRSIDASLERLGLDRIDIALVHDPDEPEQLNQAIAESVPALIDLREQGVLRAVGAGMNHWEPLRRIVAETDVDTVMIAGRWTLLDRTALPLLEECGRRGACVLAAAPFNSGLLAHAWPPDKATYDYHPASRHLLERARAYAQVCQDNGSTLPAAALQFPLRNASVATVVAGIRTAAQAREAAAWLDAPTATTTWQALELDGDGPPTRAGNADTPNAPMRTDNPRDEGAPHD